MYGREAVRISPASQIDSHIPVSVNPVAAMVDFLNLFQNLWFLGIIILLPVSAVVVISIWTYAEPPEQPANAKFLMMFINKPISLWSISFAKNAAAFLRKDFSYITPHLLFSVWGSLSCYRNRLLILGLLMPSWDGNAFFTELFTPCRDSSFGYTVFCCDAFVGASFFFMKTDYLLFKFGSVILWHNKYLFSD